jgi:hypothetical protein
MKAFALRGQGENVFTNKIYMSWPSKKDFDEALAIELEKHGVHKQTLQAEERWVRVEEIDLVTEAEGEALVAEFGPAPGKLHEYTHGKYDDDAVKQVVAARLSERRSVAVVHPIAFAGAARVTNPGDPGYVADERELQSITSADIEQILPPQ